MGIDRLTIGDKRPPPKELRPRMGTPGFQQTNVNDMKKGVESYKNVKNRKPLKYYVKRKVSEVKEAVRNGRYVQLCIDYGKFNDMAGKTGDPNFRGGHSVGVYGQKKKKDGTVMWLLWDPLDDSRRASIPQGARWVKRNILVQSMVAFGSGGSNNIWAGVFAGGKKK